MIRLRVDHDLDPSDRNFRVIHRRELVDGYPVVRPERTSYTYSNNRRDCRDVRSSFVSLRRSSTLLVASFGSGFGMRFVTGRPADRMDQETILGETGCASIDE